MSAIIHWLRRFKFWNRILRGYYFYGKGDGIYLLIFSIIIALVVVPFGIWGVSSLIEVLKPDFKIAELLSHKPTHNESVGSLWSIISQYADPGNLPAAASKAHLLAAICAILGILCLSGLLVSSLVNLINSRAENWRNGLRRYDSWRHRCFLSKKIIVIIGVNEQAPSIIRRAFERGAKYVFIQTRNDVEKVRHDIELKMDDELEDRIVFCAGERTSAEDIRKLRLENAMEIYILGESINNPNEKDHDAYNANCLEHISNYIKEYKLNHEKWQRRIRVHVDFEYQSTFTAFKTTHLYQKLDRDIEFVPFNIHEIWAKKVLVDNFAIIPAGKKGELKVQRYNPIDTYLDKSSGKRVGITSGCDKSVHLIVLGMNQLGTSLATQAALLCHFPNFNINDRKNRTTITFIDDHAKEEGDYFKGRFSTFFELCRHRTVICNGHNLRYCGEDDNLKDDKDFVPFTDMTSEKYSHLIEEDYDGKESFLDIEWEFIQGNIASDEVKRYIEDSVKDPRKTTTIAICFNHSQQSIASAMYLPADVYDHANQVLVYQQNCFDIVDDVANRNVEWRRYPYLYPFGMIENSYTENPFENHLAKLLHHHYQTNGKIDKNEHLLKTIETEWNQIEIVQKFANMDLADSIWMKYRSMGIDHPHNYDSIPKEIDIVSMAYSEHLRWTVERLIMGFRCLTKEEQATFVKTSSKLIHKKRSLIDNERAHLDICSNSRLAKVDPAVCEKKNDERMISGLPELLKLAEWISVLRLSNDKYENSQHVSILRYFLTCNTGDMLHYHFIGGLNGSEKYTDKTNHSFWMAETPVTQAQWKKVMGAKRKVESNKKTKTNQYIDDDMPVVNVSKQDVDDFLDILRKKTGLYFSLPSLKEWQYAAQKTLGEKEEQWRAYKMWVSPENSRKKKQCPIRVTKLKRKQRSKTQLRHILGNVWEWTRSEDNHHRFEFCGGSWRFSEKETQLCDEYWHKSWDPEMRSDDLGFRLIWKFDIDKYGDTELRRMMKPFKPKESKRDVALIRNWFNNRMVLVKAGQFVMGANDNIDKSADMNERPRHVVEITDDFYICNIPVTQQLWNLMNDGEQNNNPTTNRLGDDIPQTDISWADAMQFIGELNMLKKSKALDKVLPEGTTDMVFRLPTEAEWEYSAKDGHLSADAFEKAETVRPAKLDLEGNIVGEYDYEVKDVAYKMYSGSNEDPETVAWYGNAVIKDVAQKKRNDLGLYDMSGNVWEWCHDFYAWDMYDKGNMVNPICLGDYAAHVFRGGSWRSTAWDCRCTRANFWAATHKSNDIGFRLVLGKPIDAEKCNIPLKQ